MSKVKCLNCGHEFLLERTYEDEKGTFTVCPECNGSFDTDEEVELTQDQLDRNDEIYNAIHEMCKILAENPDLEWDMYYIGDIADYAASLLVSCGNRVRYPAVVTDEKGNQYICEYHEEDELQGTWEEIANAIKSGAEFKVGDYKKDRTVDGQNFTLVVTDATDEYVRFESRDCLGGAVRWNKKDTTDGGIEESNVQEFLMLELLSNLPDDLRKVISKATRKYKDNKGNVKEYETLLFLPSASEVFGEDNCFGDEGLYEQMGYYKDRRNRMRGSAEGEDTCGWWLASVGSGYSTDACRVSHYGLAGGWHASSALHVPVCFIIKKS